MADRKISDLPAFTGPVDGSEIFETVKNGVNEQVTSTQLNATPMNAQTGTTYTLALSDQGKAVECTNAAAITVTVPTNASVAIPVGANIIVRQLGAGLVTLAAASGVTLQIRTGLTLALLGQFAQVVLHKRSADVWIVTGELASI